MDANVHRAILKLAAERAKKRIQAEGKPARVDLESAFWALHQGNWLTDMNQATCFFDALEGRGDPYAALDIGKGKYSLPKSVGDHQGEWTSMFHELWAKECEGADLPVLPRGAGSREHERLNPQIIGGYYPMDHFDVVVGDVPAREAREFEGIGAKPAMTLTARSGIFEYAQSFWLHPAFRPGQDRADPFALRSVGHAAHILQDFFGHSNFVELLLMAAAKHENTLDDDLRAALAAERVGTFGAFWRAHPEDPAETPVMTGRFDRIDTLASLLGIYRRGLVHSWSDLDASPHGGAPAAADDLLFDVVFGTFSDRPYTESARKAIVELWSTRREFKALRETFRLGVLEVVASIAAHFTGPEAKSSIQEVKELIKPADPKEARRYATAGRILYLERVIETKLRHEVTTAKSRALPHHTLLAKDHDVAHPEVRLAYKLACQLATDVTTELLYHFAVGSSFDAVKGLLQRYYRHPALHLEDQGVRAALRQRTDRLYGVRWWLAAAADEPLLATRD